MRRGDIVVNPWVSKEYNGKLNPLYATIYLDGNCSLDYMGRQHYWGHPIYKINEKEQTPWEIIGHIDLCEIIKREIGYTADTPQTEKPKIRKRIDKPFRAVWFDDDHNEIDTPQKELTAKCLNCHNAKACKENHWDGCIYEPQTDCLIVDARFKAHCLNCAENGSYKCTKCDGEMYYKADAPQTDCEDIYPLVIIKDRYTGVYSNGKYTAWNMYFEDIPREIDEDDVTCRNFWHSYEEVVGLGDTPNEAVEDLRQKMGRVQI